MKKALILPVVSLLTFCSSPKPADSPAGSPNKNASFSVEGKKVVVGNLKPRRDFTFVSDTLRGFILLARKNGVEGETFNLGTKKDMTIKELIQLTSKLIGVTPKIEVDGRRIRGNQSEVMRLISDNSRAAEILGWQPTCSLEEGLNLTMKWLKEKKQFGKPAIYNI